MGRVSVVGRHIVLRIVVSLALLLLVCAADFPDFARPGPPPGEIELAQGWRLASARDLPADGAALSRPEFKDSGWHAIAECRRPFCRPCRPTAPTRTSTSVPICSMTSHRTSTSRIGGIALRSPRPRATRRMRWSSPESTIAPRSGSTVIWSPTTSGSSACTTPTNSTYRGGSTGASRTHWQSRSPRSRRCRTSTASSWQTVGTTGSTGSIWATKAPGKNPANGNSFVADRNAGIWKPVYLRVSGAVVLGPPR